MIRASQLSPMEKFQNALKDLPQRGEGLHVAILGAANLGVAAHLTEDDMIDAFSAIDRAFKPGEIEDAVSKAILDAEDQAQGKLRQSKPREPMTKAAKAGKILVEDPERTARLQADLIEAGGGEVDPFGPELRAASNPLPDLIPAVPGMEGSEFGGGVISFLREAYHLDDWIFIGSGREGRWKQRSHTKTVAD